MFQSSVTHRDYWTFESADGKAISICLNDVSAFGQAEFGSFVITGGHRLELKNSFGDVEDTFKANNAKKAQLCE